MIRFPFSLFLLFSACTIIPTQHGKVILGGDYTNVTLQDGSVYFHADSAAHSVIYTAAGVATGNVIGSAGAAIAGVKLAQSAATTGARTLGAITPVGVAGVNRHTNRATPAPVAKKP